MDFTPIMRGEPSLMDARVFTDDPMKMRQDLLAMPMSERLSYDEDKNLFLIDFAGLSVRSAAERSR